MGQERLLASSISDVVRLTCILLTDSQTCWDLASADLPKSDVEKYVDELQEDCRKAGRSVESHDDGTVAKGGSIVLVDTSKPIDQWDIIAERALPDVKWEWPWSKSRFDD